MTPLIFLLWFRVKVSDNSNFFAVTVVTFQCFYFIFFRSGTDSDLEYYVRECGDILGISGKLAADKRDAKHILEYVLHQVVEFKKLNQVRTDTDK